MQTILHGKHFAITDDLGDIADGHEGVYHHDVRYLSRWQLRISGERASALPNGERGKANVYARERTAGRFTRAIALPDDVDPGQVKAAYKDGVLQISIARREAAQPKRITVQ